MSISFGPLPNEGTIGAPRARHVWLRDSTGASILGTRTRHARLIESVNAGSFVLRAPRHAQLRDAVGAAILARYPRPHVLIGETALEPVTDATAYIIAGKPPHNAALAGSIVNHGTIAAGAVRGVRLTNVNGLFLLHHVRHATLLDTLASPHTGSAILLQQPYVAADGVLGTVWRVGDAFTLRAQMTAAAVQVWNASLRFVVDRTSALRANTRLLDAIGVNALPQIIFRMLLSDAFALHADADSFRLAVCQAVDALTLAAGPGAALDARDTVASALPLHAASMYVWPAAMSDAIGLAGAESSALAGASALVDAFALTAIARGRASFVALVPEAFGLATTTHNTADLRAVVEDRLGVLATFRLPGGETYVAWVLHADTRAYTRYSNFPFNSFCELDGKYYAATDMGLYLLEGDDDAGTPIDAHIRGGLTDMGTGKLKRQEALYLGYRADGSMLLKVITTSDAGEKHEDWYALSAQTADAAREGRIKIGRGLKSRYWGFELANVNGGDFALDSIAWRPLVLERRI